MGTTGIMVCGHGSREEATVKELEELAGILADLFSDQPVAYGFLDHARPSLREGLDVLREQGVETILAIPGMLFAGSHVKNDIPTELNRYADTHANISIQFGRELGMGSNLLQVATDQIARAEENSSNNTSREETLLMVVGRGASDATSNENIQKICRQLCDDMGFGAGEICFAGVASPLVAPGLEHAATLGYRRIIVFPYLLYTGVLINRIYSTVDQIAEQFPNIEFLKSKYLGNHPKVVETFADRIRELAAA